LVDPEVREPCDLGDVGGRIVGVDLDQVDKPGQNHRTNFRTPFRILVVQDVIIRRLLEQLEF
jgi:hypothetical protein